MATPTTFTALVKQVLADDQQVAEDEVKLDHDKHQAAVDHQLVVTTLQASPRGRFVVNDDGTITTYKVGPDGTVVTEQFDSGDDPLEPPPPPQPPAP